MNELYKAIIDFIYSLWGSSDYSPYINKDGNSIIPIYKGYDNKLLPPKTNNYVILTSENDTNMSLGWLPYYDNVTHKNTYATLASTKFKIDMYGDNAENNARVLNMLCQNGYANQYWNINNYKCSTYEVKSPINLSDIFGRDMYNKRFLIELKVFNNIVQKLSIPYFDNVNVHLHWVNNTK